MASELEITSSTGENRVASTNDANKNIIAMK
jgi:hypothetical protein